MVRHCITNQLAQTKMNFIFTDATAVRFSSSTYRIEENQRFVQLELLIVNPLSVDFTVDIISADHGATRKWLIICTSCNVVHFYLLRRYGLYIWKFKNSSCAS